jgi:hypothetical protein
MHLPHACSILSVAALGLLTTAIRVNAQPADGTPNSLARIAMIAAEFANPIACPALGPIGRPSPISDLREAWRMDFTTAAALLEGERQQPQTARTRSWPARHPVVTGALVGGAVGAALGARGMGTQEYGPFHPVIPIAFGAAVFAGVGALIGLAF